MASVVLSHMVGALELDPELEQMLVMANAEILEELSTFSWRLRVPDIHALRMSLIPGWVLHEDTLFEDELSSPEQLEEQDEPGAEEVIGDAERDDSVGLDCANSREGAPNFFQDDKPTECSRETSSPAPGSGILAQCTATGLPETPEQAVAEQPNNQGDLFDLDDELSSHGY